MSARTTALKRAIPDPVRRLCARLNDAGYRSWIVGGCVRDLLLHESVPGETAPVRNDWDIATDAKPQTVQKLFPRVIPTGIQHGTVTVLMDGTGYEVTTLRGETTYSDGRRPDSVHFVDDIVADLARRDFTVNAIAYDAREDRIIDPFDGVSDLERRVLRAVGNPAERFAEDGLRVLRAARFGATLEFELEPATEGAIAGSLGTYRKVSAERIRDEWMKIMTAHKPSKAFDVMKNHGILAVSAPELLALVGCEQNRYHAFDVWEHTMQCMDYCPPSPVLRLAGLLHDVGKPQTRQWNAQNRDYTFYEHERVGAEIAEPLLQRLRFSNDERSRIVALVRHHLICYDDSWSSAALRRWIRRVTPELVPELYDLNGADVRAKGRDIEPGLARLESLKRRVEEVMTQGSAFTVRDLAIGGADLMALGLPPGPIFGRILSTLLEEVIEDPALNEREILLERAKAIANR